MSKDLSICGICDEAFEGEYKEAYVGSRDGKKIKKPVCPDCQPSQEEEAEKKQSSGLDLGMGVGF